MPEETEQARVERLVYLAREKGFIMHPERRAFPDQPQGVYTVFAEGFFLTAKANQPQGSVFAAFSDLDDLEDFLNGKDPEHPNNRVM